MSAKHAVSKCLRKSFTFSGRAGREEFLWFAALYASAHVVFGLAAIFLFIPYLAVGFRRFHDLGRRGWPILIPEGMRALSYVLMFFLVNWSMPPIPDLSDTLGPFFRFGVYVLFWPSWLVWFFIVYVLSFPGGEYPNRYGPPPDPGK